MKILNKKGADITVQVQHEGQTHNLQYFILGRGVIPNYPKDRIANDYSRLGFDTDARRLIRETYMKEE